MAFSETEPEQIENPKQTGGGQMRRVDSTCLTAVRISEGKKRERPELQNVTAHA